MLNNTTRRRLRQATARPVVLFEQVEQRRLLSASPDGVEGTGASHGAGCPCPGCCGTGTNPQVDLSLGGSGLEVGAVVEDGFGGDTDQWDRFSDWVPGDEDHDHDHGEDGLHVRPATPLKYHEEIGGTLIGEETFPAVNAPYDLSETFKLHSLPGADHVIYLDFNGHVTTGTTWNFQNGLSSITTPAYSTDADRTSFNTTELTNIQEIWSRVAEDYAPFRVNVTTEEPDQDFLRRSGGGDQEWGVRVAIGPDNWFGPAGGVAYLNSFRDAVDEPVFVFTNGTGNGDKGIAEAASHEVGHSLGLNHDGQSPGDGEYYNGHQNNITSWAPIMGLGYFTNVTQWSAGEYRNANNFQNDLQIISSGVNGFGFKADDFDGAVSSSAQVLPQDADADANVVGTITTSNDSDAFKLSHGGGSMAIVARTVDIGPNLDLLAELYADNGDGTFTLVASANPANLLDAVIIGDFAPGDYVVRVDGVGTGDPMAVNPTGYTEYASIGQYTLTVDAAGFDDVSPEVDEIFLSSSTWSSNFLNSVSSSGMGVLVVSDGEETGTSVGFSNIDTVSVRFSERVQIGSDDLFVSVGGNSLSLNDANFSYDPITNIGTWRLSSGLSSAKLAVGFDSGISDFAGNTISVTSPFSLNVLAGDANGDGKVSLADFGALRSSFGSTPVDPSYSVFADFNASGFIDLTDFGILRASFGVDFSDDE